MTTKEGKPCAAKPREGTDLCPWHTPEHIANRKDYQRRGGYGRSNKARLAKLIPRADLTAAEMLGLLNGVLLEIVGGEREGALASQIASLTRAILEVGRVAQLEEQLRTMERRMGELSHRIGA